jgi:hypothetical protein
MNNLHFSNYKHDIDFSGEGWHLYTEQNGTATDYYIYNYLGTDKYELYYGNGFGITTRDSLEEAQNLILKIFEKFPRMAFNIGFDAEEFHAIEAFVYSSYSEEAYLNDQCEIFNRQFGELKLDMEEFKQNLRKNRQVWHKES